MWLGKAGSVPFINLLIGYRALSRGLPRVSWRNWIGERFCFFLHHLDYVMNTGPGVLELPLRIRCLPRLESTPGLLSTQFLKNWVRYLPGVTICHEVGLLLEGEPLLAAWNFSSIGNELQPQGSAFQNLPGVLSKHLFWEPFLWEASGWVGLAETFLTLCSANYWRNYIPVIFEHTLK